MTLPITRGIADPGPLSAPAARDPVELNLGCPACPKYPNLPTLLQHTGSPGFAELKAAGMNGMYLTDQALYQAALLVSALLITRL